MKEYGTVISTFEGPSTRRFSFLVNPGRKVHRGQFIQIETGGGKLIGRIADILKTNRYYMRPESVKEFEKSGKPMGEIFPVAEWEYLVAEVRALGVLADGMFREASFPVSPGDSVLEPEDKVLERFFGLDPEGLHLGRVPYHDVDVRLDMTRLFQKHLAILALSGGGKSYLAAVLIEELLKRKPEEGQLATLIIDPHGEYSSFAEDEGYSAKTRVFPSSEIRIGVSNLSIYHLCRFMPRLSPVQVRELDKVARELRKAKRGYSLSDLIEAVEAKEEMKSPVRDVLVSVLTELAMTGIFGASDYPPLEELARLGGLSVVDLSEEIGIRKKQIIVAYLAGKLFEARRNGIIPPFLLVLEEAHQFAPEAAAKEQAISKPIITQIAREGRKFHASLCLISQRPKYLATTALAQCNTHFILRINNPYDLKHIEESSEGITSDVVKRISSLRVGSGLLAGEAVNFPLFIEIRKRVSKESRKGMPLQKASIEWHKRMVKDKKDAKSFM